MPSSSFTYFQAFTEAVAEKKHDLGSDALNVALCAAANAPSASGDAVLADLTAASLTNLLDAALSVSSSSQSGGTYHLVISDKTLQASGGSVGPFRYVVVYNDTATNKDLIGYWDYGSDVTLADGETLLVDLGAYVVQIAIV